MSLAPVFMQDELSDEPEKNFHNSLIIHELNSPSKHQHS